MGEYSEERAEDRYNDHHARTLITVSQPEDRRRRDNPNHGILSERTKLALEVSTKNDFFEQAGENAQQHKDPRFEIGVGRNGSEHAQRVILLFCQVVEIEGAHGNTDTNEQEIGHNQEDDSECYVQQEGFHGLPASSDQVTHTDSAQPNSEPYQKDQHQLRDKCTAIKQDPRSRTVDCADL